MTLTPEIADARGYPAHLTADGERLDQILTARYGAAALGAMLPLVITANPHLCDYPPEFPSGVKIALPPAAQPVSQTVRLWDA
jgi:phage tail protein X